MDVQMQPSHDYRKIVVEVPTATTPSRIQVVIGIKSETENIEEFRGIPYGQVNARWEHSSVRDSLPSDVFRALQNGYHNPDALNLSNPTTQLHSKLILISLLMLRNRNLTVSIFLSFDRAHALESIRIYQYISTSTVEDMALVLVQILCGVSHQCTSGSRSSWPGVIRPWSLDPTTFVAQSLAHGKPIIAVNINYRLNVFGFGCSDSIIATQSASDSIKGGNFGLGDQRRALEWVVRNIGHFGGDNECITIGGQSAGASSVHAHVIDAKFNSGLSGPLFRRAIMQSGAVGTLGPIALSKASANFDLLRKEYSDLDITGLKTISSQDLLEKTKRLGWWVYPLVNDGLTISPSNIGRWNVSLGVHDESQRENPQRGREETLRVLLGDTDAEASIWKDAIENVETYTELEVLVRPNVTEDVWVQLRKLYKWDASATMQEHWLDFIYDDKPALIAEEQVIVYGKDTLATVVDSVDDHEIQARLCRFKLINAHRDMITKASHLITGVTVV
ncbi:hypothetical protein D6C97_10486 [Aureobasidium pullulans]|nr:hypothetical protein D6C97_10486 [Aureobasidium pullulans]TIA05653.1 hypothetical protein D6C81_10399 [Aureobasidium pullulans]